MCTAVLCDLFDGLTRFDCFEPGRYEAGHGLVDAVQFQKKLKNDLHRLENELEQRSLKVLI